MTPVAGKSPKVTAEVTVARESFGTISSLLFFFERGYQFTSATIVLDRTLRPGKKKKNWNDKRPQAPLADCLTLGGDAAESWADESAHAQSHSLFSC